MRIDLQCPVEVWRCILPDEPKEPCELILFNLGDKVIVSVEVTMILTDEHGSEISRVVERAHDMNGQPGENFSMLMELPDSMVKAGVTRLEVMVEKAWFEDGIVWRKARGSLIEYTTNALPRGRSLSKLRYIAGPDAIGFPERQGTSLWLCVCGRPNHVNQAKCARCGRSQDEIFRTCSREAVEKAMTGQETRLSQTARSATRLGSGDTRDFIARKKRRGGGTAVLILLVLALAAGSAVAYTRLLRPYLDYRQAVRWKEEGEYGKAETAFRDMIGYKDSGDQLTQTRYLAAEQKKKDGKYAEAAAAFRMLETYRDSTEQAVACDYLYADALLQEGKTGEARSAFEELAALDYGDSADRVRECDYQKAEELRAGSRWEDAALAYEALGDFGDSADKARDCRYRQAGRLLEAGRWEEAYTAYGALGDYLESATLKLEALYRPGVQALTDETPDDAAALEWLTREELDDYKDTKALREQAWYLRGQNLLAGGETEEAGSAFRQAGSYLDAEEQVAECLYRPAMEAMERGEWLTAAERFARLQGYKDADELWKKCYYQAAVEKTGEAALSMEAQAWEEAQNAWEEAAELLRKVPGYADADSQTLTCVFNTARACAEQGDYVRTLALIAGLPENYEGAAELADACVYQSALDAFEREEYGTAAASFESLGDYRDSAAQAQKAHYAEAGACWADGDYASAWELYSALGDFADSQALALRARYAQAQALETAGVYADAAAIYKELGTYENSNVRYEAVMLSRGDELLAQGQYTAAREAFAALENNDEAKERIKACDYAKAEAMAEEGNREAAADLFTSLADYSDAADRASRLWYELAGEAQAAGNLTQAAALYGRIPGYADSDAKLAEIRDDVLEDEIYGVPAQQARAALDAGDAAGAAALLDSLNYSALPERYAHVRDLYVQACYTEGKRLYDAGDRQAAYPYLQRCAGYADTDSLMAAETAWRMLGTWRDDTRILVFRRDGSFSMGNDEGRWRLADGSIFVGDEIWFRLEGIDGETMTLADVRGEEEVSLTLTRSAADTLAPLSQTAPAPTPAPTPAPEAESQESAADTDALDPLYQAAVEAMDAGSWLQAAGQFEQLAGYRDADDLWKECIYQAAAAAMEEEAWFTAVEHFRRIPGYADTDSLLPGCIFAAAAASADAGNTAQARLLLAELPEDYEGAAALRQACDYKDAAAALDRGEYSAAAETFEGLGDYGDSIGQAQRARYAQARELEDEARYADAAELYRALGAYEDSETRCGAMLLARAGELLTQGNYTAAREIYAALPESPETLEGIRASDYAKAEAMADEGLKESAAELFAALTDYSDAQERALQLWYELAEEAQAAGNLDRASALYARISDYGDSMDKLKAIEEEVYGGPLEEARTALAQGHAREAVILLDALAQTEIPERYAELKQVYAQACAAEGKRLYEAGEKEEAYPYLQRAAGLTEADALLSRETAWRILGSWQDDAHTLVFRRDGTFSLNGEEQTYALSGYNIRVDGVTWFKLVRTAGDAMTLRDVRGETEQTLQLTRTAPLPPEPFPWAAEQPSAEPNTASTEAE